jgi:hypothetical protein
MNIDTPDDQECKLEEGVIEESTVDRPILSHLQPPSIALFFLLTYSHRRSPYSSFSPTAATKPRSNMTQYVDRLYPISAVDNLLIGSRKALAPGGCCMTQLSSLILLFPLTMIAPNCCSTCGPATGSKATAVTYFGNPATKLYRSLNKIRTRVDTNHSCHLAK